jgi:hypothetical protein
MENTYLGISNLLMEIMVLCIVSRTIFFNLRTLLKLNLNGCAVTSEEESEILDLGNHSYIHLSKDNV